MSKRRFRTSNLRSLLNSKTPPPGVDLELVTDNILQVVVYLDLRDSHVDDQHWVMVEAVDRVAAYLDYYKFHPFRAFVLKFSAAWEMRSCQKTKDRKKTPNRG